MLIFAFAVFIILLRPYAAYQMSVRAVIAADPVKVNSILQRLIKKKEQHHVSANEEMNAIAQAKIKTVLPVVLRLFLIKSLAVLSVNLVGCAEVNCAFQNPKRHKRYLFLSCIQL